MTHVAPLIAALALFTPAAAAPVAEAARVVPLVSESPTHPQLNDDVRETLSGVTLALSSAWIAAVIDANNRVAVRSFADDIWPDADDDLDVDASVALQRRWYLSAPPVQEVAERHPVVAAACYGAQRGDGTATVIALGTSSIAVVYTRLSILPVAKGRALPVAMPVVTIHPVVVDVDTTLMALTKGRPCTAVQHRNGEVHFNPKAITLTLPHREQRQRLRFACTDRASLVAAAARFVDVLAHQSRDAVHALPVPFVDPELDGLVNERVSSTLSTMRTLGWRLEASAPEAHARRSDEAVLLLELTDAGQPVQARVRLRAGDVQTTVDLAITDDTCSLSGVPFPWSPYTAPHGEQVFTEELSGWRHVGETWVKGPAPHLVNTNKKAPPTSTP